MRATRLPILFAAVALLLVLPMSALAQAPGEPEAIDDPVAAMEPEIELEPAAPAAGTGDDVAAQAEPVLEVEAVGGGATTPAAPTFTAGPVATGTGQLPFTGLDSGRLMQLFLVGSVLLSGGLVSLLWAGARTERR